MWFHVYLKCVCVCVFVEFYGEELCGGGECGSELCLFQRGGVHICMCVFGGGWVTVCSLSMCGFVSSVYVCIWVCVSAL